MLRTLTVVFEVTWKIHVEEQLQHTCQMLSQISKTYPVKIKSSGCQIGFGYLDLGFVLHL